MPRKRKRKNNTNQNKMTMLGKQIAQIYQRDLATSFSQGIKSRKIAINFDTLEKMADRNPIISAIIQKRTQQIRVFCQPAVEESDRGFVIKHITGKGNAKRVDELTKFFMKTGFEVDIDREDDFADFMQLVVRDVLTFDQNGIEIRRTKGGDVFDFWYVDGTTMARIIPKDKRYKQGYRFAQKDERGKVQAVFTPDNFIFDYMNKRGRLKHRGFGFSLMEMAIDLVTTFLFSMTYNKDLFIKEKIPKGFLKVLGDVNQDTINAVRNHWIAEMQGYGAKFTIPVIGSSKDGVGIDWQPLGQSNREMEYNKLILLVISLMCAVYSIDPSEIGIKTETHAPIISQSGDDRLQQSKDTGLGSILAYGETICNKILERTDDEYIFKFVGVRDQNLKDKEALIKQQLETRKTIDEIREAEGDKPFNKKWSSVVLNTQAIQLIQAEEMGGDGDEGYDEEGEESIEEDGAKKTGKESEGEEEDASDDKGETTESAGAGENVEKSRSSEKYLDIVIK